MKAILVVVAVFLACVEAKPMYGRQGMDQDVLEISKSNMIFKCQVAAVEDTPGKLELKVHQFDMPFSHKCCLTGKSEN